MRKLEELKAAHEAATPGEWLQGATAAPNQAAVGTGGGGWLGLAQVFGDTDAEAEANARFITLAHNLMPQMLEAARELANFVEYLVVAADDDSYAEEIDRAMKILRGLK